MVSMRSKTSVTGYEEEDHNESNHICAGIEAKGWDRRIRKKKLAAFEGRHTSGATKCTNHPREGD
jgi:hypothetical protein